MNKIAKSSPRIIGLLFGSEDFLAEQEGSHGENAQGIEVPRHIVAMAAKANNLMAIDTPFVNVGDFDGLKKHISQGRNFGYDGMLVMSPREISIINDLYAPSELELKKANEIVRLADEAEKENRGIVIYDGVFVSPPTLKASKKLLQRANDIMEYKAFVESSKK